MSLKTNVFTNVLSAFIDRLVELSYYQFFVKAQLERANETMKRDLTHFDNMGWDKNAYFFGSGVAMTDIFHDGEFVIWGPTKGRVTAGEDVLRLSDETERQFNAFMVVLLFEAVEAYLRSVYGKFLIEKGNAISLRRTTAFHKAFTGWEKRAGTPEYLDRYAQFACQRDCSDAIDDFEEQLDWGKATIIGCFGMTYHDFIRVLGTCRHCIVHNHGRITSDRIDKMTQAQNDFVNSWIAESLHGKERLLLPPTKPVDKCFEHLVSYGRGLYVLLSESCGMEDDTNYFN